MPLSKSIELQKNIDLQKSIKLRESFAAALQSIRKNKGMTQEDFSNASSRTYLSTLERAIKSPTLDKIDKLSSVLQVHRATLVVLASMYNEDDELSNVIEKIKSDLDYLMRN